MNARLIKFSNLQIKPDRYCYWNYVYLSFPELNNYISLMKNFSIDNQTFKDLNIFTESTSSNSIFNLFKGTRTLGARERLKEIMESPSSDIKEITLRRDSIKYFYNHKINLDIKNEELDLIEFYLKSDKRKFRNNLIDAVADYATRNSSNDYYIVKTGLKYLIKLAKYISGFIRDNTSANTPAYLVILFEKIGTIIGGH